MSDVETTAETTTETTAETTTDTTKPRQFRVAEGHWKAYKRVCDQLGMTRAEDLYAHIRQVIAEHGDEEAQRLAAAADAEVAERRARMHTGRPRKTES